MLTPRTSTVPATAASWTTPSSPARSRPCSGSLLVLLLHILPYKTIDTEPSSKYGLSSQTTTNRFYRFLCYITVFGKSFLVKKVGLHKLLELIFTDLSIALFITVIILLFKPCSKTVHRSHYSFNKILHLRSGFQSFFID